MKYSILFTRPDASTFRGIGVVIALALTLLQQGAIGQGVDLGGSGRFGVLAGSGITVAGAVQTTTINGDIGTFPTPTITGLGNITLNGVNQGANAVTQQAKMDLLTAYNSAASRAPTLVLTPGLDVGGLMFVPGVYKDSKALMITGSLTLNALGNPNAVFIFQIGSTLTLASNSNVILLGGAQACHIFWQVGSSATLGTSSNLKGSILALTSITLDNGATVKGRLLAENGAVTLDTNTISVPKCLATIVVTGAGGGRPVVEVIQGTFQNALSEFDLTANQSAVAAALDHALDARGQRDVLGYLDSLPLGSVPSQLDRISPEELTSLFTLGFAQFETEVFSVQQRLAELRDTAPEDRQEAPPAGDGKRMVFDKGEFKEEAKTDVPRERLRGDRWGFFLSESGEFASLGDTGNAAGFDSKSAGTTIGMDVLLSARFALGLTVGYARTETDLIEGGKIKSDGGKAALYALYHQGGFYTEALVGGGCNSYTTRRGGLGGHTSGDTDGQQFDAYLGVGYDLKMGRVTLTPVASLLYTDVAINGFDEHGSLAPLHIHSQDDDSLRSRVGLRAAYDARLGGLRVTPSVSAEWQHDYLDTALPLDARFANGGGAFTVHGPDTGRDGALLTAAVNVGWDRYSCHLAYQADVGRTNYETQTVLAGFRVSW